MSLFHTIPTRPSTLRAGALCLLLAAGLACPAPGATVTLNNGQRVEGQIVSQDENAVTIRTLTTTFTFPRSRIASIDEGAPGSAQLFQAREALGRGDTNTALQLVEQAKAQGADEESWKPVYDAVRDRQAKDELRRYAQTIDNARADFQAGRQEAAIQSLASLAEGLSPDSPAREEIIEILCDFHLTAAKQLRDRVQNAQAVNQLRQVISLDPNRPQPYIDLGDIYKMSGATFDQAMTNYRKAVEVGQGIIDRAELARIHWEMAEISRQRSDWREAAINYHKTHQLKPDLNLRLVDRLGDAFVQYAQSVRTQNPDLAIRIVEEGNSIRPNAALLNIKAEILHARGDYDASLETCAAIEAIDNRRLGLAYLMAQNYFAQGQLLQGREMLQREVTLNPRNYDALCLLGDYAAQRGDTAAAIDYYTRARAIDSDTPRATLGLGRTYRQQGDLTKARQTVQEVLARIPEDREANLEMGRIFRDENNLEEAKTFFSQVLTLLDKATNQDEGELKKLRADALIARGEISLQTAGPGTANQDFRAALTVLPDYDEAFYSIGRAYRKKYSASKNIEDLKIAEENLLKARQISPENPQYALEVGILYAEELSRVDKENEKDYLRKAVLHWKEYIELGGANIPQVRGWIQEISMTIQS